MQKNTALPPKVQRSEAVNTILASIMVLLAPIVSSDSDSDTAEAVPLRPVESFRICTEDWPPFHTFSKDGHATGSSVEVVRTLLTPLGINADFVQMPGLRCAAEVRSGGMDGLLSASFSDTDIMFLNVPLGYAAMGIALAAPIDIPEGATVSDLLRGKRMLLAEGYPYDQRTRQTIGEDTTLIRYLYGPDTVEDQLKPFHLIETGRVDGIIEDLSWLHHMKRQHGLNIHILDTPLSAHPLHLGLSEKWQGILKLMEHEGSKLLEDDLETVFRTLSKCSFRQMVKTKICRTSQSTDTASTDASQYTR